MKAESGRREPPVNEVQRRFLRNLRDAQPVGLRRSSIPKSCTELIVSLQTCGAVEFKPANRGRGVVLCIKGEQAFQRFIAARLPQGLDVDISSVLDRAAAVVMLADAKAIRRGVGQGIFVRSTKPDVAIQSTDGEVAISVSELTTKAGGAGIQLSPDKTWTFNGDIAIVENADAFWQHELVLPDVDLVILSGGNMSERLVKWLASPAMSECRITHWGDYDPVGVWQYLRLLDACQNRVGIFAPPVVDELLPKYGKRKLVTRQSTFFDRIRTRTSNDYVRRMVGLFDKYRRGLEQEILLHPSTRTDLSATMI